METACTPVAEDREAGGVETVLYRYAQDQVGHLRVDDLDYGRRHLFRCQPEWLCDARQGLAGQIGVETHAPAQEVVRIEPAEHEARVCHGGLCTTRAVTSRAR